MRRMQNKQYEVVVVGAGLAGQLAAVQLAKAGRSVLLLEQSKQSGGRAATTSHEGIHFNLGPRALYCHGHAFRLLRELEVPFSGRFPSPGLPLGYYQGRESPLPLTTRGLFQTGLLSVREKWQLARLLRRIPRIDTAPLQTVSVREWVTQRYGGGPLAQFLFTLFRLTSYAAEMEHYSAGAAIDQLRISLSGNVWYVDQGWQSLINELQSVGARLGVNVCCGRRVSSVHPVDGGVRITVSRGEEIHAGVVVLAIGPHQVGSILDLPGDHPLQQWTSRARPVHAACLDVALTRLPRPQHRFALGIDRPYYFSVHSAAARLAAEGVAVMHVMKYLRRSESTDEVESELEGVLDRVQPGWRNYVLRRRCLPSMLVAPDLPQAQAGGLTGRPDVDVAGIPGVFVAGDWVGPRGQLADASAASAEEAVWHAERFLNSSNLSQVQYA